MFYTAAFEFKRIYCNKNHITIFLFFLVFSLYFVNTGVKKYRDFFIEKENFLNYEKQKINRYVNYEQYGAYGFRVLFQPTPMAIFNSSAFLSLEGTIDTKEIVNISINYKGKRIFANNGAFGDYSSMFYTFGSLIMLYFGLYSFFSIPAPAFACKNPGKGEKERMMLILNGILPRLLFLNGYFSGVILMAYVTVTLQGISFTGSELKVFVLFSLYMILFINLFYLAGVLFSVVLSFKKSLYMTVYALCFFLCFFVPEFNRVELERRANIIKSNETVNMKKLNNVMRFERRYKSIIDTLKEEKVKNLRPIFRKFSEDYMRNESRLNRRIENNLSEDVNKLIFHSKKKSVILPSSFYLFLTKEFSSYGYINYQLFFAYMMALKNDFSHFYFEKRYAEIGRQVESFVKGEENIFKPECTLPENFLQGLSLTFFYALLLFGAALRSFRKRIKAADEKFREKRDEIIEIDIKRMEKGKTYFSLCRHPWERESLFFYLLSREASIIERLSLCDFDPGISLKSWLLFECRKRGIAPTDVYANLEKSGIAKRKLKLKIKTLSSEILNRAYLEIRLCEKSRIYVFDDFLKDVSKDFEKYFKQRVKEIGNRAIIIYVGSELFDINVKDRKTSLEDSRFFIVDPDNISLR